jgi:hypothetical protein
MTDRDDLEKTLREFQHQPSERVKRAVMSEFERAVGGRERRRGFWRRPMPLYAAAVLFLAVAGLSFWAGQHSARAGRAAHTVRPAPTQDVEWCAAETDLL